MTNIFSSLFSSLIANTPPSRKGLPSRKFLPLFLILFLAVGNAWGAELVGVEFKTYDVGAIDQKPGSSEKFGKCADGLYMWRASSGHSYSEGTGAGKGIKTENSKSGLIFYIDKTANISPIVNFNASKNAANVTATLYAISADDYNKFLNGTVNSTTVTFETTEYATKTITIENVKGNYSETLEDVPAGYYFIVCKGTASNTYFNQITFSTPSTPPTTYTVTYDINGSSCTTPTQEDVAEGATFTLAAAPTAPAGKEFDGWSDGTNTYAAGATYKMGSADVILIAQWKDYQAKYTVIYKDGETELGSETVNVGSTPIGITPTKDFYTFINWNVDLSTVNGVDGETITLTAQWGNPIYAVTFDFGASNDLTKDNIVSKLLAAGYIANVGTGGSYDAGNTTGYLGYKFKNKSDKVSFLLKQGTIAIITYGYTESGWNVNGVKESKLTDKSTSYQEITYTAVEGDKVYTLENLSVDNKTSTLTKIEIKSLYNATLVDEKSNGAGTKENISEIELTEPTAVEGFKFTGWKANADVLVDGETISAGTIIAATKIAVLSTNTTFTAQWTATYTVTYDLNGVEGTAPTQAALVAGEKFTVAATDGIAIPDGKTFAGWSDGANTYAAGSEYTMPASNVTLTAQWIDNNNVARIGDTYYTNLDDAVAYANSNPDAEIVLLKDIDRAERITLTANTIINLNGNKLSKTDGGWLIFVKEGATLTINGETENSAVHGGISLGAMTNNNGSLVINGGKYTCADGVACVHVNGTCLESDVKIIGANLTSPTDIAVQLNGKGTYTIENASITGATGVYIKSGVLTVTNSTIKGTKTPADYSYNGNGANATGDAIVVDACDYPGGAPTLNIISGTFEGTKGAVGNYNYNGTSAPAIGGIQGGTFNTEVPDALCADGYIPVKNGDDNYGVTKTAKTFSLEDLVTTQGVGADYEQYLNNLGWSVANASALDNLNTTDNKLYDNYPYLGLKFKSTEGYVEGIVEGNKLLTIQLGHMAADADLYENSTKKISLSGKDAETAAVHYYYVESTSTIKLQMTNANTCVLKAITVADPFTVTFNTNGGETIEPMQGKPSITLPTPTNGTLNFKGWYDAATDGNKIGDAGIIYTPTADVTLYAQWEAVSSDTRLSDLQVDGVTVTGFNPDVHIYYLTVSYGTAVEDLPKITTATPYSATAGVTIYPADGPEWRTDVDGGCYVQQANVTAENGEIGYNQVRISIAPKDGVSIIKATHTGAKTADKTGLYANDATIDKNTAADSKLGGENQYFGFTLASQKLFNGDRVVVFLNEDQNVSAWLQLFSDKGTTMVIDQQYGITKGANTFTLSGLPETGISSLYLYRTAAGGSNMNPYATYIEVTRAIKPVITSFSKDGMAVTPEGTNINLILSSAVTQDAPTVEVVRNGNPATPYEDGLQGASEWVVGANTYRVYDKDGDYTDYTVTITVVVPPVEPTITNDLNTTAEYIEGGSTTLSVLASTTDEGVLSYQWYKDGVAIEDANNASLDVREEGTYKVVVTNTLNGYTATATSIECNVTEVMPAGCTEGLGTAQSPSYSVMDAWTIYKINSDGVIQTGSNLTQSAKNYVEESVMATNDRRFVIKFDVDVTEVIFYSYNGDERTLSSIQSTQTEPVKNGYTNFTAYTVETELRDGDKKKAIFKISGEFRKGVYYRFEFSNTMRIFRICYTAGYLRIGLTVGNLGTICLPSNVPAGYAFGATFYELVGKEPQYGKIVFDEIVSGELQAGKPYLFQAQEDKLYCFYGTESVANPDNSGAMKGTFEDMTITDLTNIYYFAQKALWSCVDLTSLSVPANRAYVKMDEMPPITDSNPAPGRRRITLGVNGQQVATGMENVQGENIPTKMIINGQLFILRGEKMYDAQGKLVK